MRLRRMLRKDPGPRRPQKVPTQCIVVEEDETDEDECEES